MIIGDKRIAEIEALANEWENGFPSMAKVDATKLGGNHE